MQTGKIMTPVVCDKLYLFNLTTTTITNKVIQRDTQKQNRYIKMEFLKLSMLPTGLTRKREKKQKNDKKNKKITWLRHKP